MRRTIRIVKVYSKAHTYRCLNVEDVYMSDCVLLLERKMEELT